jgi:hypothetical protein
MIKILLRRRESFRRILAGLLLMGFSAVILAYLWWGRVAYFHGEILIGAYVVAIGLVAASHFLFSDRPKDLGLRVDNLGPAAIGFGIFTGIALIAAGLVALQVQAGPEFRADIWTYAPWALLQQHLLQNFLRLRAADFLAEPGLLAKGAVAWRSALMAALLFSLFHLPNLHLAAFTLAAGFFWCILYSRNPNLLISSLSQIVLGSFLIFFFKPSGFELQVGLPGHRYEYYGGGVQVAAGFDDLGRPFVATLPGPDRGVRPLVRIFSADGALLREWNAFEEFDFSGQLAVGDLGWGPGDVVAITPGPASGNPPLVRIFSLEGRLLSEFEAGGFQRPFGAWIGISCRSLFVSSGPGPGSQPLLLQIRPNGAEVNRWNLESLAFENSVKGLGICEEADGVQLQKLIAWGTEVSTNSSDIYLADVEAGLPHAWRRIPTFPTTYGVQAALLRGGGELAVAAAPGPLRGYPPWIRIFTLSGEMIGDFVAFESDAPHGATLAAVDVDGDGIDELIVGEGIGRGQTSTVRVVKLDGSVVRSWVAYP